MTTELDLDIAALVGELEALPCEHSSHTTQPDVHTDEASSHYLRFHCPDCGHASGAYAACPGFVAFARSGKLGRCRECKSTMPTSECITVLGPVNQ